MPTTVANAKTDKYQVYVGRPSCWGNPFSHRPDTLAEFKVESLEAALHQYGLWIVSQPHLMAQLDELRGKVLGCWCRPKSGFKGRLRCHAQILAALCDGCKPEDIP